MGRNTFWDRDQSLAHYFFTFFTVTSVDIASYADDTTPYICCKEIGLILEKLETSMDGILKRFNENAMQVNPDKFYHLVSAKKGVSLKK